MMSSISFCVHVGSPLIRRAALLAGQEQTGHMKPSSGLAAATRQDCNNPKMRLCLVPFLRSRPDVLSVSALGKLQAMPPFHVQQAGIPWLAIVFSSIRRQTFVRRG